MILRRSAYRPALLVVLAALALAGCGRRGPLEAPPSATPPKGTAAAGQTTTINESIPNEDSFAAPEKESVPPQTLNATPLGKPPRTNRAITIPKRDFFLDPIL